MDINKYYSQLVGCKIVGFRFEDDPYSRDRFPVFTLEAVDFRFKGDDVGSQRVKLSLSIDAEGNGGGFGFIEEVKK